MTLSQKSLLCVFLVGMNGLGCASTPSEPDDTSSVESDLSSSTMRYVGVWEATDKMSDGIQAIPTKNALTEIRRLQLNADKTYVAEVETGACAGAPCLAAERGVWQTYCSDFCSMNWLRLTPDGHPARAYNQSGFWSDATQNRGGFWSNPPPYETLSLSVVRGDTYLFNQFRRAPAP